MLKTAAVFSDHMVLQRERPIPVFGEADGSVRVSLAGREAEAVPINGRFCAYVEAMPAGGPYEMTVCCGGETRSFTDVMVGEVWLCGGQSNMEFVLRDDRDGVTEVATGEDALLRFYTVNEEARVDEAMLAREEKTAWKPLAPGNCGDVSAVAYYAGRRLRAALGVPVGMLICCIGGTEISCWISREELTSFPDGKRRLDAFEADVAGVSDEEFEQKNTAYMARVEAWCATADAMKAAKPGVRVSEIAKQAGDFPWPPPMGRWMLRRPGGPWETMVLRIAPYGARGLFWYQGETDAFDAAGYDARFAHMIAEWRRAFENEKLSVAAAQLPGFGADPTVEDWPAIRRAQEAVWDTVEHCELVCLLDCGESEDIHPWAKREPGTRLANAALKEAYGVGEGVPSPRLKSVELKPDGALLRFTAPLAPRGGKMTALRANGEAAEAEITPDGALWVKGGDIREISYAQCNDPKPSLFGENGLPAFPFERKL